MSETELKAKYAGVCTECGRFYQAGDRVAWGPRGRLIHNDCKSGDDE